MTTAPFRSPARHALATPAPLWLSRVASASQRTTGTSELVAELLKVLQELTGLESTYLTQIHQEDGIQEILRSVNAGELTVPEGHLIAWEDTLCRRAMAEPSEWVDDVKQRWPDSDTAKMLAIDTYVSTPVNLPGPPSAAPWGTLCGAARHSIAGDATIQATMRLFAQLIGDAVHRDNLARTQEDRIEQTERRLRQRTELAAAAEHAMKSPAATIRMWAETLAERWQDLDDTLRGDALARIQRSADRLLDQISDLVREARAELMAGDLDLEPVDLHQAASSVARELGTEGHRIVLSGDPVMASADRHALALLVEHLVDNARAHTPRGTTITLHTGMDDGAPVLVVRDDGPGLPVDVDIFVPFVRGDLEHTTGTGLGLHIVQSFAEAMGGTVEATNADRGTGAVFTVRLTPPEPL